mmetsp:Transcript_37671/g.111455  ORF Transcript_37671/g.111455 Transcript_37671/m.111455 type:complete len:403 (-) Transcript_37671:1982-3190(-)
MPVKKPPLNTHMLVLLRSVPQGCCSATSVVRCRWSRCPTSLRNILRPRSCSRIGGAAQRRIGRRLATPGGRSSTSVWNLCACPQCFRCCRSSPLQLARTPRKDLPPCASRPRSSVRRRQTISPVCLASALVQTGGSARRLSGISQLGEPPTPTTTRLVRLLVRRRLPSRILRAAARCRAWATLRPTWRLTAVDSRVARGQPWRWPRRRHAARPRRSTYPRAPPCSLSCKPSWTAARLSPAAASASAAAAALTAAAAARQRLSAQLSAGSSRRLSRCSVWHKQSPCRSPLSSASHFQRRPLLYTTRSPLPSCAETAAPARPAAVQSSRGCRLAGVQTQAAAAAAPAATAAAAGRVSTTLPSSGHGGTRGRPRPPNHCQSWTACGRSPPLLACCWSRYFSCSPS